MPHHINQTDGALVIEFGYGDLGIATAETPGEKIDELVIWPNPAPMPIGDKNLEAIGKSTSDVKALVRLVFHDPRSLDVLIHQANRLRALMAGEKWTAEEHDATEYVLTTDNDGHWYVANVKDEREFYKRVISGLNDDFSDLDVKRVGGSPTLVKFKLYRID